MAKIQVLGDSIVITSAIKAEDIKLVERYNPKALELRDEEGAVYFKVAVGSGSISKYGISFGGIARDGSGAATLTLAFEGATEPDKVKDQIADAFGVAIANLNAIEAGLPAVIEGIAAQKAEVVANITVG